MKEIVSLAYFSLDSTRPKLDIPSFITMKGNAKVNLVDFRSFSCNADLPAVEYKII